MSISFDLILHYLVSPLFLRGAGMTLLLTVVAMTLGILIGFLIAILQEMRFKAAHALAILYLWLFRGTPVLLQIIFVFNVLPSFGLILSGFASAVLALSLNEGAYMAEIIRSGLQAVKKGQRTAGLALGMRNWQVVRHIVIPQALRIILPPTGNQMIGMLKLSALVSVIAVEELLLVANQTASANFKYLEALTAAGIYYLAMTTIFMMLIALAERSLAARRRTAVARISFTQRLLGATGGSAAVR
jgi:polar amino acid transport system permease protein